MLPRWAPSTCRATRSRASEAVLPLWPLPRQDEPPPRQLHAALAPAGARARPGRRRLGRRPAADSHPRTGGSRGYAAALVATSVRAAEPGVERDAAALPVVFATMHLSFAFGFLWSAVRFGPPIGALAHFAGIQRARQGRAAGCVHRLRLQAPRGRVYAQRAFALFLARLGRRSTRSRSPGGSTLSPASRTTGFPTTSSSCPSPTTPRCPTRGPRSPRWCARWAGSGGCSAASTRRGCSAPTRSRSPSSRSRRFAGKRVFLGVRQDWPAYVRSRHPQPAAPVRRGLMEAAWRGLARAYPVVVVGRSSRENYRRARRCCRSRSRWSTRTRSRRRAEGRRRVTVLSVGRLETEKNPLLLADILAGLWPLDPRWRLVVAGEGPMRAELEERLAGAGRRRRTRTCAATCRSTAGCTTSTASATSSCTCPGPRACRRSSSRRSPLGCPWWPRRSAACRTPPATPRCWCRPAPLPAAVEALVRMAGDDALRERLVEAGVARVRRQRPRSRCRRVAEFFGAAA